MRSVVYIDVLFVLNMFVNYFILVTVAKIMRITPSRWRLLCGALLGGLYSLFIFIPDVNVFLSLVAKLAFSVSIVFAAYKNITLKLFFKLLGGFYLINFAFAGIMLAIWFAFKPPGIIINNGVVYFDVSILTLTVSTIVCYIVVLLISRLLRRNAPDNRYYDVTIMVRDKKVEIRGIVDTGNSLCDAFTDKPVIIAEYDYFQDVFDEEVKGFFGKTMDTTVISNEYWKPRLRLVPFSSVGKDGLLPAFKPESILIQGNNRFRKCKDVIVAISYNTLPKDDFGALLNPRLVE